MIENQYNYNYVKIDDGDNFTILNNKVNIRTHLKNSRIGVLLVGIGGNNGSTFTASILARQKDVEWENKNGKHKVKFLGSIYEYGSINIGYKNNKPYTKLIKDLININSPEEIVVSGWDICNDDLYTACKKNKVLDLNLMNKIEDELKNIKPMKSICYDGFIAKNQKDRSNNLKKFKRNKWADLLMIKSDIESFKIKNNLDKVVVVWTASTERFNKGNWKTSEDLLNSIKESDYEVSPSIIFATASILSGCIFLNGSPQNTICTAILDLANKKKCFIAGEDFKTGQTKLKSVLVDFLASSGIKPLSIVSYNHLGNNDGKNLNSKH